MVHFFNLVEEVLASEKHKGLGEKLLNLYESFQSNSEFAFIFSRNNIADFIDDYLKESEKQAKKQEVKQLFIHELLYSESDEEIESFPYEKVLGKVHHEDSVKESADSKSSKRGRPKILQLLSRITDSNVVKMVKDLYSRMFNMAIEKATQLLQYLSCFFCALFSYCSEDGETPCGKVKHFWSILNDYGKISNLPRLRTLQESIRWLSDKKKIYFRCVKEDVEEFKHKVWEHMQIRILKLIGEVAPVYFV